MATADGFKMVLLCQIVSYLPMWSDCIHRMSTRTDQCPSWWRPASQSRLFPRQRLCSKSSWDSSSFWLVSIRLLVLKSLLLSFGFGRFALLLSVSHSAWPTALCSNYMVGEGWESVRVSTRPPPLPQSTALHISVWLWFKNCGLGSDRIPWKGLKKNLKNRQSYWQSVMNVLLTTAKLCLSDSYMVSKPARTYYACRKVIER